MSIYEDLCSEFSAWRDAYFEDKNRSRTFAGKFIAGYASYIGAPSKFRNGFYDDDEMLTYIFPCSVVLNDEERTFKARREENVLDILVDGEDHRWYFAIGTTLEMAKNTYPKQWFPQLISFFLDGNTCHLRITTNPDGEFTLNVDDLASFTPAYDFIVSLHKREMRKRRIQLVRPPARYGFDIQPVPLPEQQPPALDVQYPDDN